MDIKFELNEFHRNTPEKELLEDLVTVSQKLNKTSITEKDYMKHGRFGVTTIIKRFGHWNHAIGKAALNKNERVKNTDEMLFENLLRIWLNLGRQPLYSEIAKPLSNVCITTYERRFGGWRNALQKFVQWVNSEDKSIKMENTSADMLDRHRTKRDVNLRLRFMVFNRDNFKCVICGQHQTDKVRLHVDHIIPYSKGGETELDNLQTLCEKCNYGKSDLISL